MIEWFLTYFISTSNVLWLAPNTFHVQEKGDCGLISDFPDAWIDLLSIRLPTEKKSFHPRLSYKLMLKWEFIEAVKTNYFNGKFGRGLAEGRNRVQVCHIRTISSAYELSDLARKQGGVCHVSSWSFKIDVNVNKNKHTKQSPMSPTCNPCLSSRKRTDGCGCFPPVCPSNSDIKWYGSMSEIVSRNHKSFISNYVFWQ